MLLLFLTLSRNRLRVLPEFALFASSSDFTRGFVPNLFLFLCKEGGILGCGGGPRLNVGFGLVWNGGGLSGLEGGLKLKDGWSNGAGRGEGLGVSGSIRVKGGEVVLGKLLNLFLDPGEWKLCGWGVAGLLDGPGLKLRGDSVVNIWIPFGVGLRGGCGLKLWRPPGLKLCGVGLCGTWGLKLCGVGLWGGWGLKLWCPPGLKLCIPPEFSCWFGCTSLSKLCIPGGLGR